MNTQQAQSAVSLSAFVVAVIFAYRKLTEPATKSKTTPQTSHFVIGFGFVYVTLSLLAQAAPTFGGMMAVLVATGDTLANGGPLINDLTGALKRTAAATTPSAPTAASSGAAAAAAFQAGSVSNIPNASGGSTISIIPGAITGSGDAIAGALGDTSNPPGVPAHGGTF